MKRGVATFLVIVILMSGCFRAVPDRNYVNGEHGFRMDMPEGWSAVDSLRQEALGALAEEAVALREAAVIMRSPEVADAGDAFISVRIVDAAGDITPRRLYDEQFPHLREIMEGFRVEERDDEFEAGDSSAYLIRCRFNYDDKIWKGTILFVVYGKRGAVVLCACLSRDYSTYKGEFSSVCRSFFLE